MSKTDWHLLNQRRSCSLLARRTVTHRGAPTTPTAASLIAALQVQEALKLLHGMDALLGRGFVFDGMHHESYVVQYPIDPSCGWHEPAPPIETMADLHSGTSLATVWERATQLLGAVDALDLSRDVVASLECPACGTRRDAFAPPDRVPQELLWCQVCHEECVPRFLHSLTEDRTLLERTVSGIGLPLWDIVWARNGENAIGIELAGDNPFGEASSD